MTLTECAGDVVGAGPAVGAGLVSAAGAGQPDSSGRPAQVRRGGGARLSPQRRRLPDGRRADQAADRLRGGRPAAGLQLRAAHRRHQGLSTLHGHLHAQARGLTNMDFQQQ